MIRMPRMWMSESVWDRPGRSTKVTTSSGRPTFPRDRSKSTAELWPFNSYRLRAHTIHEHKEFTSIFACGSNVACLLDFWSRPLIAWAKHLPDARKGRSCIELAHVRRRRFPRWFGSDGWQTGQVREYVFDRIYARRVFAASPVRINPANRGARHSATLSLFIRN